MALLRDGLLFGMGNPLLDISTKVDLNFLKKYNLEPNNAILAAEEHMPLYKELVEDCNAEYIAGGSVQNSLRVAQWILQKPNVGVFFGCVGNDNYSKILETRARQDGVNVMYEYTDAAPTGTCGVLITGTNRSLCAHLGAANLFTIDHVEKNKQYVVNCEFIYISGFFLTVSPSSILCVADIALEMNKTFIMNLSAPFISQFFRDPLKKALPYVDVLFGNETEGETFAKEENWGTTDLKEIAVRLCNLPKHNKQKSRIVIITQGQHPVIVAQNNKIEEFPVDILDQADVVDTNGAGDAFVGGFLAQFVQQKPLGVCIRSGNWAARQIIQQSGCKFSGAPAFKE